MMGCPGPSCPKPTVGSTPTPQGTACPVPLAWACPGQQPYCGPGAQAHASSPGPSGSMAGVGPGLDVAGVACAAAGRPCVAGLRNMQGGRWERKWWREQLISKNTPAFSMKRSCNDHWQRPAATVTVHSPHNVPVRVPSSGHTQPYRCPTASQPELVEVGHCMPWRVSLASDSESSSCHPIKRTCFLSCLIQVGTARPRRSETLTGPCRP
jgi:hypothetical protein